MEDSGVINLGEHDSGARDKSDVKDMLEGLSSIIEE